MQSGLKETSELVAALLMALAAASPHPSAPPEDGTAAALGGASREVGVVGVMEALADLLRYGVTWPHMELGSWARAVEVSAYARARSPSHSRSQSLACSLSLSPLCSVVCLCCLLSSCALCSARRLCAFRQHTHVTRTHRRGMGE